MYMYKEKKKNLIVLIAFAAVFSIVVLLSLIQGNRSDASSASEFSSTVIVSSIAEDVNNAFLQGDFDTVSEVAETFDVDLKEAGAELEATAYTVTEYENAITMYASDTVNVRQGAGTEYNKIGKVAWGTPVAVTGVTDNGWCEVSYKDSTAFIRGDFLVDQIPGTPYVFVGDSRTVQLQMAVGSTDKAYIAKIGEGYSYFKNTVIPSIPNVAGYNTSLIINFGVNDLRNANKYVKLVNSYVDTWINAGVTVYYAAVTPVGAGASVSNAQIESFNATLKDGLDSRVHWIDGYSFLQQTGFSAADGLHYSKDTYKNLYGYYMAVINEQQNQ
jgi:uncharacterized protein YraI